MCETLYATANDLLKTPKFMHDATDTNTTASKQSLAALPPRKRLKTNVVRGPDSPVMAATITPNASSPSSTPNSSVPTSPLMANEYMKNEVPLPNKGRSSPESEGSDEETISRMQRKRKNPSSMPLAEKRREVQEKTKPAANRPHSQRTQERSWQNDTYSSEEEEEEENDSDEDEPLYCICRRPYDAEVFMIACDFCDEWYHGKCVDMTERKAKNLDTYTCPSCLDRRRREAGSRGRKRKRPAEVEKRSVSPPDDYEDEEGQESPPSRNEKRPAVTHRPIVNRDVPRRACANEGCDKDAQTSSKYCSTKCGILVAKQKLEREKNEALAGKPTANEVDNVKQERRKPGDGLIIAGHGSPRNGKRPSPLSKPPICVSDSEDLKLLQSLESQRNDLQVNMSVLRDRGSKLVAAVNFSQTLTASNDDAHSRSSRERKEESTAVMDIMDCFSCGQPIPGKNFARHIEQCYAKKEGNVMSSTHKNDDLVADDGSTIAYCNYYDSRNGSYCTCLADTCPFHSAKKKKVIRNQLCGAPTTDFQSGYCERLKKDCAKHLNWENIRRLELAQELKRCNTYLAKIEEDIEAVKARIRRRNLTADNQHRTIEENHA